MRGKPGFGFCFRDDGEDLDFFFGDVIEHSDVVDPQAILRACETAEALNPAFRDLRWLIAQMRLDRVADGRAIEGRQSTQALDRLGRQDDLEAHLARI